MDPVVKKSTRVQLPSGDICAYVLLQERGKGDTTGRTTLAAGSSTPEVPRAKSRSGVARTVACRDVQSSRGAHQPSRSRPAMAPSAVPSAGEPSSRPPDDLPNPQEEKRRALRQEAITDVIAGRAKPVQRERQHGRQGRPHGRHGAAARSRRPAAQGPVRRARPGEDRQDLRDPRRVRQRAAPELPRPGHRPRHARAGPLRRPAAQRRSPSPTARSTTRRSGSRTTTARTTSSCTSAPAPATSRSSSTTSGSPPAATASTAPSPTGSRSATTRPGTAGPTATRAPATCAATPGR